MRFAFTEEQLAFRDAVRDLLAKECPPETVRAAWSSDEGRDDGAAAAWSALAEMGVLGVLAPEGEGGLGLTEVDLVLLLEETGYAALPEPIVEHACVAVPLVAEPGPLLDGSETVTAAAGMHDSTGRLAAAQVSGGFAARDRRRRSLRRRPEEPGTGAAAARLDDAVVPYADRADRFLLNASASFRLVARAEVQLVPLESVDGARTLARLEWDASTAPVIAEGDAAAAAFDRGAFGTASQLVGLTRRMIDMTVEYAKDRRQFGVPIGSFQAVKHRLADARLALEFARPRGYRAAWSLANADAEATVHVSMAKATASDAALLAGRQALQCHGAIGYSFEYDLHLFMKRAWALAAAWGDASWHRDRVGRAIL